MKKKPAKKSYVWKNNIRKLREKRGLPRSRLARSIGVSDAMLGRLESGKALLTKNLLLSLAGKLNTDTYIVADVPVSKKVATDLDDALLGCIIGWLFEFSHKMKVALSRRDLSYWTNFIYNEVIKERLNFQENRYLVLNIVRAIGWARVSR